MKHFIPSPRAGGFRALAPTVFHGLALVSVLVWLAMPASAATRIWLGNDSSLWSDPDNWSPSGVPQNGDSLTFASPGFSGSSINNDLVNLSLSTITFTGSDYSLNGNALTLIQGITDNHSGALNRVRCDIQFTSGTGRFNSLDVGQLEIAGTTTLANDQNLIITASVTNITVSGVIQGNGGLVKRGEGTLFLRGSAANTYTGPTRVEGGAMHLAKTSAVRAISANVTIDGALWRSGFLDEVPSLADDLPGQYPPALSMLITNSGDWRLTNGATVTNLFLDDSDVLGSGLLNLECDVTTQDGCKIFCALNVGSQSRTFTVNRARISEYLEIHGNILGPLGPNASGIIKEGRGELYLKNQNTYLGPTLLREGDIIVQHGGALGAASAGGETRLQVGLVGGDLIFDGGTFTCPETIVAEAPFARIFFTGNITLTGSLTVNASDFYLVGGTAGDRLEIRGVIAGPGGLVVNNGTVRMSGSAPNSFGGDVIMSPSLDFPEPTALELAKPDNVVAVPGSVYLSGSGTNTSVLRGLQNGGVSQVVLYVDSWWEMNGHVASPSLLSFFGPGVFVDTQGGQLQFGPGAIIRNSFGGGPAARIIGRVAFLAATNELELTKGSITHLQGQVTGGATILQKTSFNLGPGGTLILDGDNQFTGPFIVQAGQLRIGSATALGTTAAGTFVNNNASLALDGGVQVTDETLTLDSTNAAALVSLGPVTNTWNGPIILQRTVGISVPDARGGLSHFGLSGISISGPGGFTKSGPGALFIGGSAGGNSYTGPTTINDGLLEATRRPGRSLSDNIVVAGANSTLRTGRASSIAQLSAPTVLPIGASVTVQDSALWAMNGTNFETLSRLVGNGRLTISTGGALTVSNSVSCEFSGMVNGSGALNKSGLATLSLTGDSPSYIGLATVFGGSYLVAGRLPASPVTVKGGSALRGHGLIGDLIVEAGGVVKLESPEAGALGGDLEMSSANFMGGSILGLGFYGPYPTGGNDSLLVNNAVTLTSPALSSGFQYPPHEGDVITVVQKIAAGAITGAFSGFPEGAMRMIGQIPVVASYVGGNGNDMTLTVTNLPLRGGGTQLVSGNGGSALVPNDCSLLRLVVTNRGTSAITGLRGVLRSLTPGVVVTMAKSAYPDLAPNARGSNATPFQIRTEPAFPCGGGSQFELVLTGSNIPPTAILYTLLGASGYHLDFDGRDDQVDVDPNAFSAVVNNFTMELWANPAGNRTETAETNTGVSVVSHRFQRFAVFPDRGNLAYGLSHVGAGLSIGRNGISVFEQGTNHLPSRLVYSNAVSGWTHVALVYANRQPKLYVNGALVRSGSASLFGNVHASGSLGGSIQGDDGNFEGQLDEVRIWNIALSQTQIQSNMSLSLTGTEPNLVTYFRCDEAGGSVLTDSASASPNPIGTLANGAAFVLSDRGPFTLPGGPACDTGGGACESCFAVRGTFTTNTPTLSAPLDATGSPSLCSPARPCPGAFVIPLLTPFIQHTFANTSGTQACVTAQLHFDCPASPLSGLHVAAYLGPIDTNSPCLNYLGDSGGDGTAAFSFPLPAGSNVVILVTLRAIGFGCDNYTLQLFGLPCPPPPLNFAASPTAGKVVAQWSSAYPDFRLQSVNSINGSGPVNFNDVITPPVLVGGKFAVTNAATTPRQFFRLAK